MGIRVHIRKRQSHIETVKNFAHRPLFLALGVLLVFQAAFSQSSHTVRYPDNIELEYDRRLSSIGFPNPLLKATVQGQTAWFIIDTGARVHTFASWLVSASGLRTFDTTRLWPVRPASNRGLRLSGTPLFIWIVITMGFCSARLLLQTFRKYSQSSALVGSYLHSYWLRQEKPRYWTLLCRA
jgi:hypothetical protein